MRFNKCLSYFVTTCSVERIDAPDFSVASELIIQLG